MNGVREKVLFSRPRHDCSGCVLGIVAHALLRILAQGWSILANRVVDRLSPLTLFVPEWRCDVLLERDVAQCLQCAALRRRRTMPIVGDEVCHQIGFSSVIYVYAFCRQKASV